MSIRLVLADDHPFILDALEGLFRLEEDIEVVARCADGVQAIEAVRQNEPHGLILDMRMPGADGLAVMRALRDMGCQTWVVLLAGAVTDWELVECLRLGVRGVVMKEMAPAKLVQCVRSVQAGHVWVEEHSITKAIDLVLRREAGERELAGYLTRREIEIVQLVAAGLRNKDIARRLTVTEGTVKVHLHNIYTKLGVDGRMELLMYAREHGLA
jgi:DNA-binding NarL/FixJ family response regulator